MALWTPALWLVDIKSSPSVNTVLGKEWLINGGIVGEAVNDKLSIIKLYTWLFIILLMPIVLMPL